MRTSVPALLPGRPCTAIANPPPSPPTPARLARPQSENDQDIPAESEELAAAKENLAAVEELFKAS